MLKLNSQRGQAALEYLMTYGWAILIVGFVGLILWQMGIFKITPSQPGYSGFSQVRPLDWALYSNGTLSLVLVNEAGTRVNISQHGVIASIFGDACCCSTPPCMLPACPPASTVTLRAGETTKVDVDCSNVVSSRHIIAGEYYRAKINISYRNLVSGMDHRSIGECWGTVS